jgi:catechol 2,3-dioxygenase-like lactoylglutathione lyase family enzyme
MSLSWRPSLSCAAGEGENIMRITGITFVGTRTHADHAMALFARDVLGLTPADVVDGGASFFALPDGSSFAVTHPGAMEPAERTVGFLVDDVEQAAAELRAAGVPVDDEVSGNDRHRYVHLRAPDGQLYELVEEIS